LTWDRGLEIAKHKSFTVATNVQVYFCDPQSPWQRGTNENTNLLLRQYFPRGTDLSAYSQAQLNQAALRLNQRPRKTLGFQTPASKLQKGKPTLGRLRFSRRSFHPSRNRSFRDVEAEHKQFAMNARCSPCRVLRHHAEDQLPNFFCGLSSSYLPPDSRDQPPIHLKTGAVPTDHRLGRNHDESLFPT
jgi:hypothetical protein